MGWINFRFDMHEILHKIFGIQSAFAHCDIPCGIYTPEAARTAAKTVAKMVEKIEESPLPDWQDAKAVQAYENSIARFVANKEKHAQLCKEELLILWTDYFKPEHVALFPHLHETFWKAAKLCSKNKQEANREAAQDLRTAVEEIAQMFQQAEQAKQK